MPIPTYFAGQDRMEESPCPVSGLYTGHIPDETSLCAKLSSECAKPETMHYAVQVSSSR